MKKIIPNIAGALLGAVFMFASIVVLFKLAPEPKLPPDSDIAKFMGVFGSTGYFTVVKVVELIGGVLLVIPKTRNFGLLVSGPIIVNICIFNAVITHGEGFLSPMFIVVAVLALYLLWHARKQFGGLLN